MNEVGVGMISLVFFIMSSDDSCLLSLLLLVFFLASGFVMFLKQTLKADLNFCCWMISDQLLLMCTSLQY